ncbi:MAG: response regulator [Campylobacterota bacterium]|nr:response regulator [Campylobacterota bacterium]
MKNFEEVVSTTYADSAIKLFESGFFDLIITDMHLVTMEITQFCSKIKHIAIRKPIIILSKEDNLKKLIKLVNIGIAGYIKLPLITKDLINILSNVVNNITELKMMYNYQDNLEKTTNPYNDTSEIQQPIDLYLTQRDNNISALEFLDRYPIDISNSIDTIRSLNETFDLHLNAFINNPSKENIKVLADELEKFSSLIEHITEFNDIAFAINKLSITFRELEPNISYKQYTEIFLDISESLNKWFEDIFINKSATDIHFLDKSMIADALTLENIFRKGNSTNNDSIEFF